MARLGIPLSRTRATLIAVLAALAAMAIAVPASASAVDWEVSLSCTPTTIEAGETTNCLATVSSEGTAPAPTDQVGFFFGEKTGYIAVDSTTCDLQPVAADRSSCTLPVSGYAEGEEQVTAFYPFFGQEELNHAEITIREGEMRVFCEDPVIVQTEGTECRAYIPTEPGAPPATGTVEFDTTNRWYFIGPASVEPECELEPVDEGAGCSVTFISPFLGEHAVLGEYEGDGTYPAETGTEFLVALLSHETSVEANCAPQQPLLSKLVECTMTVTTTWPPTGPPPVGWGQFDSLGTGSFPNGTLCEVKPIAVRQSSCSVLYRPEALGPQTLQGGFFTFEPWNNGVDEFELDVKEGRLTATTLHCELGKVGAFRPCVARVKDIEGGTAISPTGLVTLSGKADLGPPNSCRLKSLSPTTGFSSCQVDYRPSAPGALTLRAEYQDEGSTHKPSKAQTVAQVLP